MKVVKILGSGCCSCDGVKKAFEEVIVENKLHVKIEKIEDIMEIMKYDVMSTPGIVIDEKVVMTGKTPTKQEIEALILDNFSSSSCCSDLASNSVESRGTDSCSAEGKASDQS